MAHPTIEGRVLRLFAQILEYPQAGLIGAVRECQALASMTSPQAAALLGQFAAFVEKAPLGRLEEVYTGSFDLDAACHPYVGYHLFGESYKRSVFLLGLKERYRAHGFDATDELPDHIAVMLNFLATCGDAALAGELIHEALVPALEPMAGQGDAAEAQPKQRNGGRNYQQVLQALRLVLQQSAPPVQAVIAGAAPNGGEP